MAAVQEAAPAVAAAAPSPHAVVIEELLLALIGYTGDVFVESGSSHQPLAPWQSNIELAEDVDWLDPPDRCPAKLLQERKTILLHLTEGRQKQQERRRTQGEAQGPDPAGFPLPGAGGLRQGLPRARARAQHLLLRACVRHRWCERRCGVVVSCCCTGRWPRQALLPLQKLSWRCHWPPGLLACP